MISAYAIVFLYLLDSMLAILLPVSRGTFLLFIVPFLWLHADRRQDPATNLKMAGAFATLTIAGIVGSTLSDTGQTAIFYFTLLLVSLLWVGGSRVKAARALIKPRAAMAGVVVAHGFLLLSLLGINAYDLASGIPSNRAAGLFSEPSHFGLYVTPLWLIAYQRQRYRGALWAMLIFSVGTLFSLTYALALAVAALVRIALEAPSFAGLGKNAVKYALVAIALIGPIAIYDPVVFEDKPLSVYVTERLLGLVANSNDDPGSISSLVVLQGFEIASESVRASAGLGVGLGNLGLSDSVNSTSFYKELINRLSGEDLDLNLRDGALLLNKLAGELGVFAVGVVFLLRRQFMEIRRLPASSSRRYHAALFAFLLTEIFVRGLPYFSAPSCLAIISMATLVHSPRSIAARLRSRRRTRARRHQQSTRHASISSPSVGFND